MADDPLALLDRIEAYEAINDTTTAAAADSERDDEFIGIWVPAISRRIDELCGPVVKRTITDERHDGGRHVIRLRHVPISSVTTVTEYDGTAATVLAEETNETKPDDAYLVDGGRYDRDLRRRSGESDVNFAVGRRNVEVTYEAGRYADTASVDPKFKMTAAAILRRLWSREAGAWAAGGDPFAEAGQGQVRFHKTVDPMVREFLADELRPPAVG